MQNHKTLVSGTKRKAERACDGLRTYEEPPEVKVFDIHGNFLRNEQATFYKEPDFNNRRKK